MKTFKDVKIGETFYTIKGKPSKKISENMAISLVPELCGFDFQDVRFDDEFKCRQVDYIYGINEA